MITSKAQGATAAINRMSSSRLFMLVAFPLFALYLITASWSRGPVDIDGFTNVVTAWRLGTAGTVYLPDHVSVAKPGYIAHVSWIIPLDDTAVSKYPPGAALHAAPLYVFWPQEAETETMALVNQPELPAITIPVPPYGPAVIVSSLVVALAMGFLTLSFRKFASGLTSVGAGYVAGLGTSAWSVAAATLWQHGPGMMWVAAAGLLSAGPLFASGAAYGVAVLVRPLNAFIAAANGLYISWKERSWKPAFKVGIGATLGLAAVVAYNAVVFGEPSILGGYGGGFVDNAQSLDLVAYGKNVGLALVSPTHGVLIWSSFLILLLPGLGAAWRVAPSWVRGGALGGLLYLLIQLKLNRFTGGGGFMAYRYPLEPLTAAAPLLFLSYTNWVVARPRALWLFRRLAILSIAAHTVFALVF